MMKICKVHAVYFSATGNTKFVVSMIAEEIAKKLKVLWESCDFTLPDDRKVQRQFGEGDLVIFGTPVYAGRVPNKILPTVQSLFEGNGALAVPVVTFGNRSYDNALIELRNELEGHGFHTIAAAAFVAEHSFSRKLATGRPDQKDREEIVQFASQVTELVEKIAAQERLERTAKTALPNHPVPVKGTEPIPAYYRPLGIDGKPAVFLKAKPKTKESCTECKLCVSVCPMGSIDRKDPRLVTGICIKCQACIKACPEKAKYFDDEAFLSHLAMLEHHYLKRAKNEIFII